MTIASAPAKIILFGEHFVIYNQPAILASINKRIKIDSRIVLEKKNTIRIETKSARFLRLRCVYGKNLRRPQKGII